MILSILFSIVLGGEPINVLDHAVSTRIARPTDQLDIISKMYRDGLGLELLGKFEDHAGFDGVIWIHSSESRKS